jgi:hypothetical protein
MRKLHLLATISLVLFGTYVSLDNARFAHSSQTQVTPSGDAVSKWEKRIQPALEHVPEGIQVVGYVAEWDLPGVEYNLVDQDTEYTLTQYALAPRSLQPGLEPEWIIGNFTRPGFREWLDQNLPSYEIREIGFGIYLIHRSSQ